MSSRLFQEIREKRALAYSIYSFVNTFSDTGALIIYAATDPEKAEETLDVIRKEILGIIQGDLSASELDAAKEHLSASLYLSSESADSRMIRLAKNEILYGRDISYEELVSRLEAVTLEDVASVAGNIFGNGNTALATLGPIKEGDLDTNLVRFT
jgi:predicted Zn-dependent peptidase